MMENLYVLSIGPDEEDEDTLWDDIEDVLEDQG